jgi:hypothetical protein
MLCWSTPHIFYKNLFGPVTDAGVRLVDNIWEENEKLNEVDRELLDRPFTAEEIHQVIDQMERNKAAGPDDILVKFYQHCWEIVREDTMSMFNDFHNHHITLERINYGIITFIPKCDEAEIIQKYMPIYLLQLMLKIFTKALAIRVEPVMHKLIHPYQDAFIKGRYITDGVMLLQEVLRESKSKKKQGVILKKPMTKML